MRVAAFFVALVLLAGPSRAAGNDPPIAVKAVLNIAIIGGFLERNCPQYRLNLYEFQKFATAAHVELTSILSAYPEYFAEQNARIRDRTDVTKEDRCRYFADAFGEHGAIPNMVVRR